MTLEMNRREAIAVGMASIASLSLPGWAEGDSVPAMVRAHDDKLKQRLAAQVMDAKSRWAGAVPDEFGLHHCSTAAGFLRDMAAAYYHPQSEFHGRQDILERMKLASGFLVRSQNGDGLIDLISTNFSSPPDTAFVVHSVGTAAKLAKLHHDKAVLSFIKEFLVPAGEGLVKGGIHTPNHRWVVCAALAQIHDLFPEKKYCERIEEWLAEGIDIDAEGQFTERSTSGYNAVVDTALVVTAHRLKRPALLDPVRKNLDAMAYLLHSNGEVVTEISRRQDLNTRGTMGGYWFVLRYMAIHDANGLYASMLQPLEPEHSDLARTMEYPELQKKLPAPKPIPDNYEKDLPLSGISRIRRGKTSVTIIHKGNSRWVSLRSGEAVVNAVRFASAFFGKGQFIPAAFERRGAEFRFRQELMGRYLQPLTDPALLPVTSDTWPELVLKRKMSGICRMVYEAAIRETPSGFELSISARGTDNVPLAVEVNLREGGTVAGVVPTPNSSDAFLLKEGFAEYRLGDDVIHFGPGHCEHAYVQVRGAEAKLSGPSVYLTGLTPFEYTLTFEMGTRPSQA